MDELYNNKLSCLTTTKQEEFKFIVNCFFENNQSNNEQNETFRIPNVTINASIANESQSDAVVSVHELSTDLNESIVTNIITAPTLTENRTINTQSNIHRPIKTITQIYQQIIYKYSDKQIIQC